jgi:hypothetical protein
MTGGAAGQHASDRQLCAETWAGRVIDRRSAVDCLEALSEELRVAVDKVCTDAPAVLRELIARTFSTRPERRPLPRISEPKRMVRGNSSIGLTLTRPIALAQCAGSAATPSQRNVRLLRVRERLVADEHAGAHKRRAACASAIQTTTRP